jgi:hypothetical protein
MARIIVNHAPDLVALNSATVAPDDPAMDILVMLIVSVLIVAAAVVLSAPVQVGVAVAAAVAVIGAGVAIVLR